MDLTAISNEITKNILELKKLEEELLPLAEDKANALGKYEMVFAQTMVRLKNQSDMIDLEGTEIIWTTTGGLEKIVKGIIWEKSIRLDLAVSAFRVCQIKMDNKKTIINALQSKLKYIEME